MFFLKISLFSISFKCLPVFTLLVLFYHMYKNMSISFLNPVYFTYLRPIALVILHKNSPNLTRVNIFIS